MGFDALEVRILFLAAAVTAAGLSAALAIKRTRAAAGWILLLASVSAAGLAMASPPAWGEVLATQAFVVVSWVCIAGFLGARFAAAISRMRRPRQASPPLA